MGAPCSPSNQSTSACHPFSDIHFYSLDCCCCCCCRCRCQGSGNGDKNGLLLPSASAQNYPKEREREREIDFTPCHRHLLLFFLSFYPHKQHLGPLFSTTFLVVPCLKKAKKCQTLIAQWMVCLFFQWKVRGKKVQQHYLEAAAAAAATASEAAPVPLNTYFRQLFGIEKTEKMAGNNFEFPLHLSWAHLCYLPTSHFLSL